MNNTKFHDGNGNVSMHSTTISSVCIDVRLISIQTLSLFTLNTERETVAVCTYYQMWKLVFQTKLRFCKHLFFFILQPTLFIFTLLFFYLSYSYSSWKELLKPLITKVHRIIKNKFMLLKKTKRKENSFTEPFKTQCWFTTD